MNIKYGASRAFLIGITLAFLGSSVGACAAPQAQQSGLSSRRSDQDPERNQPRSTKVETVRSQTLEAPSAGEDQVRLSASLAHSAYTRSMPQRITLKVDFYVDATERGETELRPPLNLALLIDRSGSMADDRKFEQTMAAVGLIIENLTERDYISVIAFSDDAVVLSPAGPVVNKAFLRHRLSEVEPKGWTNISAGLLEAVAQIEFKDSDASSAAAQSEQISKKILLLTDGNANRGVTSSAGLQNLVEAARSRGIAISTMGVGTEFDGKLLELMADAGGGRYSYVEHSEDIPAAMSRELDGFLAVLAQNAELSVSVGEQAEIVRIYGRLLDRPTRETSFKLGDLRAGERGTFLFAIAPRKFENGSSVDIEVSLLSDSSVDAARHRPTISLRVPYTEDPNDVVGGKNPAVTLYADVLGALEDAEEAVLAFDRERAEEAKVLFDIYYEIARTAALESRDQQLLNQTFLLKHFMKELLAADEAGTLHDHDEAKSRIGKEVDYRRYLLEHHRD